MNLKSNVVRTAAMLAFALLAGLGTGCGGIGASGSVSPATFFLPGLGQVEPQKSSPAVLPDHAQNSPEIAAYSSDLVR